MPVTTMTFTSLDTDSYPSIVPLQPNTVELLEAPIAWAIQVSHTAVNPEEQWETLLQALAVAGFEKWLGEGAIALPAARLPDNSQSLRSGVNCQVGDYRLCIVAMGSSGDDTVEVRISSAAEGALAHLYVLVEVYEEVNQVCILSGLRHSQLLNRLNEPSIRERQLGMQSLQVPVSYFDVAPEQILLQLGCLEPVAAAVEQTSPLGTALSAQGRAVIAGVIDASCWARHQLDAIAQQLSWTLLPPLSAAMRPVQTTSDHVLEALLAQGIRLPEDASGAGGAISVGPRICQIYAWVWPVETETQPEWALFLLLGPSMGEVLPAGIQLEVSDRLSILTQEVLAQSSPEAYLYTQVQARREEQLLARIIWPDGMEITLPAFSFGAG